MSATENVVESSGFIDAFYEAKAFKREHKLKEFQSLYGGNSVDGAGAVCNADADRVAATAERVCAIFADGCNALEIGGKVYTLDWLKDRGHLSAGDLVYWHYLGSYLKKVANSVGGAE